MAEGNIAKSELQIAQDNNYTLQKQVEELVKQNESYKQSIISLKTIIVRFIDSI